MTGFVLALDDSGDFSISTAITEGNAYGIDVAPIKMAAAKNDMENAYADAASRETTVLNFMGGSIAGSTLTPGVYTWMSAVSMAAATSVTLEGGPFDTFILKTAGAVTLGANAKVLLKGGARASNVVWQVSEQGCFFSR
jgi:hypothetical protein